MLHISQTCAHTNIKNSLHPSPNCSSLQQTKSLAISEIAGQALSAMDAIADGELCAQKQITASSVDEEQDRGSSAAQQAIAASRTQSSKSWFDYTCVPLNVVCIF